MADSPLHGYQQQPRRFGVPMPLVRWIITVFGPVALLCVVVGANASASVAAPNAPKVATITSRPHASGDTVVSSGTNEGHASSPARSSSLTVFSSRNIPLGLQAAIHRALGPGSIGLGTAPLVSGRASPSTGRSALASRQGVSAIASRSSSSSPTATLTNASGASYNEFGYAVALSSDGTTALVGAWNYTNSNKGAAYVFHVSREGSWATSSSPTATLTNSGGAAFDQFGDAVALSADGTTALIGANEANSYKGAAYVFHVASEGSWAGSMSTPTATLTNSAGSAFDGFGGSVAMSSDGTIALIGAESVSNFTGAAYVFHVASEGSWSTSSSPTTTLTNSGGATRDSFGDAVAMSSDGTIALIGACGSCGINLSTSAGAAYVFHVASEGSWSGSMSTPTATLTNSSGVTKDALGSSVAMSSDGTTALIGADGAYSTTSAGAAYVFNVSSEGSWVGSISSPSATLTYSGAAVGDALGTSVAMSANGSTALIGASHVNSNKGATYVFQTSSEGSWSTSASPVDTLANSGGTANDVFGTSVAMSSDGTTAFIGADGVSSYRGAAYVFAGLAGPTTTTPTSVMFSPNGVGATASAYGQEDWAVGFTTSATGALGAGDTIRVTFPSGFVIPATPTITLPTGFIHCSATASMISQTVTITLANSSGTCSLGHSTPATLTLGVITNPENGTYPALGFSVATSPDTIAASPASNVVITLPAATQLVFTTEPSNGTSGAALSTEPVVTIEDAFANPVTSSTAPVTLSINGATLACTSGNPVHAVAGVATFSGCVVSGQPGTNTLQASSPGLSSATSSSFVLGTEAGSPFFTSPFSATATTGSTAVITVTASGTPTPAITLTSVAPTGVDFTPGTGSGTLTVGNTAATGSYTLTFTATNTIASVVTTATQTFTLTVAPSNQPTSLAATASATPGDAVLTWVAPAAAGTTSYTITPYNVTTASFESAITGISASATSDTVMGLTAGDGYTFTVTSLPSATASAVSNEILPVAAGPAATATGNTSDSATGTSTASIGTAGSTGSISASATGEGSVSVATYSSGSAPVLGFSAGTQSYDVSIAPGSDITALSFTVCGVPTTGLTAGEVLWYNPATQTNVNVSPAPTADGTSGCYEVNLNTTTSIPLISQLTGSIFAVPPAPLIAQAGLSVTSTSGTVGTALTLAASGGSGTGAVSFSVVAGTANGCAISNGALSVTSAGTCTVMATKAADSTYLVGSSLATTVTFAAVVVPVVLRATKVNGSGVVGRTVTLTIAGTGFNGHVTVTSNEAGTTAVVSHVSGRLLTVRVTVRAGSRKGEHTFTIRLANGKSCRVTYLVK